MNKYIEKVIPQRVHDKALKTIPGKLASLLYEVLYDLSEIGDDAPKDKPWQREWPGRLASLLDEVLYDLSEIGDDAPKDKPWQRERLSLPEETTDRLLLMDKDESLPKSMQWILTEKYNADTRKLLREIAHYLEAQALKEVLSKACL